MIAEWGHYALILALALALMQAIVPLIGIKINQTAFIRSMYTTVIGQWIWISLAFALLAYAFLSNDFSVAYVAQNSNSKLPAIYRFCALWGAHEGSLLLWVWILSFWTAAVSLCCRKLPLDVQARILAVLGMISTGFLLFILITSNPFLRFLPQSPLDGQDLNPLLQDPGLAIHPPMLYMGYVGFSVAFAFALAALISGRFDATWARWMRPWTLIAWCFLTLGIIFGSWWAYRELGWGGWWFWDPVENASFLPWLVGTALLHSLVVTEKRDAFKAWTTLLAICTFSLSLLGTFLVRSGVLVSVHAFAVDPSRGVFMLVFLLIVIGGSLSLYAWRAQHLHHQISFRMSSRESLLLFNNLILSVIMFTILLGTLYPLIVSVISTEKISVGSPYFNAVFAPLMLLLMIAMIFAPISHWQYMSIVKQRWRLLLTAALAFSLAILLPWFYSQNFSLLVILGLGLALWLILATVQSLFTVTGKKLTLRRISANHLAMVVAHIGLAISVIGVVINVHYSIQREVRMQVHDRIQVGSYDFEFLGTRDFTGANYNGVEAGVMVRLGAQDVALLRPQEKIFTTQNTSIAKTAIDASPLRDLYVALGEPLGRDAWSFRIYYKPFVRWIWGGGILMILGGLIALRPSRRIAARSSG
jgi:cytochrome c-type biogenesis protein CcmF